MDRQGLGHLRLPVVRRVRGVIEPAAVATPSMETPAFTMEGSEYELAWPWQPTVAQEAEPDRLPSSGES